MCVAWLQVRTGTGPESRPGPGPHAEAEGAGADRRHPEALLARQPARAAAAAVQRHPQAGDQEEQQALRRRPAGRAQEGHLQRLRHRAGRRLI